MYPPVHICNLKAGPPGHRPPMHREVRRVALLLLLSPRVQDSADSVTLEGVSPCNPLKEGTQ